MSAAALLKAASGQIDQHHFGPFRKQKLCRRHSDAAGAVGDHANLALHLVRHERPSPSQFRHDVKRGA